MRQMVKKGYDTHQNKRLRVGFSFCFWIPPDYWIPLSLMKSLNCLMGNINLDLGTSKLKLEPYSATYIYVTLVVFSIL